MYIYIFVYKICLSNQEIYLKTSREQAHNNLETRYAPQKNKEICDKSLQKAGPKVAKQIPFFVSLLKS